VTRIRILLAETPPMLTDILVDIASREPDLELIGSVTLGDALDNGVSDAHADVLILGVEDADDATLAGSLLEASPRLRVVMLARTGARAIVYELRPVKTEISDVSPPGLLQAIRSGGAWLH
jgi:DNA-binding NarL/FixJ family response regulator